MKLNYHNFGFSYIEATMITAILGVVAAISIPAYLSHLDRAKLAEAYTLMSSKQSHVLAQMVSDSNLANSIDSKSQGKYGNVSFSQDGVITYVFTDKKLAGHSISLKPIIAADGSTNWACTSKGEFPSNPCSPFE